MKKFFTLLNITCFIVFSVNAQDNNPMLNNGLSFLDTPYVANTLEVTDVEELIVNCDEVDCTTFVEYVLAMSLCPDQGDDMDESDFIKNLQKIRYRDGVIDGYTSRLHYTTDWINNNIKKKTIEDITVQHSKDITTVQIDYMTTYPAQYKHLKNSPENVAKMALYEKQISGQTIHWIPKDKVPAEGFDWVKNGDIIAITTNISGLDISHMGLAIYIKENLHLLHASLKAKKVVVEPLTLNEQLNNSKNATGIRVLRMKN